MHDGCKAEFVLEGFSSHLVQFVEDKVGAEAALVNPLQDLILDVDELWLIFEYLFDEFAKVLFEFIKTFYA